MNESNEDFIKSVAQAASLMTNKKAWAMILTAVLQRNDGASPKQGLLQRAIWDCRAKIRQQKKVLSTVSTGYFATLDDFKGSRSEQAVDKVDKTQGIAS
jgi:hypothetical protein